MSTVHNNKPQHTRVRPRLSAFLRANIQGQPPEEVDQALLDRQAKYARAIAQAQQQPASSASAGDAAAGAPVSWDAIVKASTRGGRLGGALKNGSEAKDAFHKLVRLATQLAGEEGAMDSAAGLLFEVAAAPNATERRAEYEGLVQRSVKESSWLQAVGWAETLVQWHREAAAERAAALAAARGGGGGGGGPSNGRGQGPEEEVWGSGLRWQDGMVPTPELEDLADEEAEAEAAEGEGGAGAHACFGRDGRDDADYAAAATAAADAVAGFADTPDANGLLDRCEAHVALTGGVGLGPVDLAKATLDILGKHGRDEAELQARLFDLFGAEVRRSWEWGGVLCGGEECERLIHFFQS
jgi:hypothetical protein